MKKVLLLALFMLAYTSIYAGGYRVAIQGQRMLGMAHAGLSVFDNPETAFFNPAGMSFLKDKFAVSFGVSGIISKVKFQNSLYNWQAETQNPVGTPVYLYLTYQAEDNISFGLAIYTPFGSSAVWDDKWTGSQIVRDISMKVFYIQPSLAYKFSDMLSVSASLIMAYGNIEYEKDINRYLTDEDGNKTYASLKSGTVSAAGYDLSLAFRPSNKISLGVNYRSKVILDAKYGKADFENVPAFLADKLKTSGFSAKLPMPAELGIGMSVKPIDKLLLAFDYNRTYWSVYEQLVINFASDDLPPSIADKYYKDTNTYRVGAAYQVNDKIAVRAGYYYDESPLTEGNYSPETPSLDSNNYTFGIGYQMNKLAIDFSLLYVDGKERTDYTKVRGEGSPYRFGGTYVSNAIIPGIGFTYKIK